MKSVRKRAADRWNAGRTPGALMSIGKAGAPTDIQMRVASLLILLGIVLLTMGASRLDRPPSRSELQRFRIAGALLILLGLLGVWLAWSGG